MSPRSLSGFGRQTPRLLPLLGLWLAAGGTAQAEPSHAEGNDTPEVTVRALSGPSRGTETTVLSREARLGAGTQGDPVKVLQSLPGLGRGSAGSGDIIAWGSPPRESKIYVDGVELPRLYHGSGIRSVLPAPLLATLSVFPGAFGVDAGDSVGGVVRLSTSDIDETQHAVILHADLLDAGAVAAAPVAGGRAAVRAAARYGYVDRWLSSAISRNAVGLVVVPSYWDAQADATVALRAGESVRVAGLTSSDESRTNAGSADPSRLRSEQSVARFGRVYAKYTRLDSNGSEGTFTPFVGWDTTDLAERFGERPSALRVGSTVYGLRARERRRFSEGVVLSLGADLSSTAAHIRREGSAAVPRREGDPYPFGTPPGDGYAVDAFDARVSSIAPYLELEAHLGPFLLKPGVRVDGLLIDSTRNRPPIGSVPDVGASTLVGVVDPRASVEYEMSPRATLFVAGGRYHQAPDVADLGAVFGNPTLGPERATHLAFGERTRLSRTTTLELVAFSKWLTNVPARAADPTPALSQAIVGTGTGRSYGTQLFLRQRAFHGFSGFLSATIARSERQDPGHAMRLSDYDAPLVAAMAVEKVLGSFRVGLRARYASGLPRTPVVGAYYNLSEARYQPELGPTNSVRLDDFFELDVRIDRKFSLSEESELDVYVDGLNVTAHRNQEDLIYSGDFRTRGSVTGLPTLVVAGVSVSL